MSQIIEAMCYARWSQGEQQAGYAWKTTRTANEKVENIMKDIQALWDQIEYEEDIYLQGEWQTDIEVVYFGTVLGDQDENGRPTHVKQVWVMEKSLWLELNAPFWGNHHWFAQFQSKQQGDIFIKNAQEIKKHTLTSTPTWLESLVAQLIKNEEQILVVCEDNYDAIFRTFSLLPSKLKKQNLTVAVGWHTSLLRVATNYNIVFCPKHKLDQVQQDLAKYDVNVLKSQQHNSAKVTEITATMFSRQQKSPQREIAIEKQPLQVQQHVPVRVSLSSVVFATVFIVVSWFGVSSYLQARNYSSQLETTKEELQKQHETLTEGIQTEKRKNNKIIAENIELEKLNANYKSQIAKLKEEKNLYVRLSEKKIAKLEKEKNRYIKSLENEIEELKQNISTKETAVEAQQKK